MCCSGIELKIVNGVQKTIEIQERLSFGVQLLTRKRPNLSFKLQSVCRGEVAAETASPCCAKEVAVNKDPHTGD